MQTKSCAKPWRRRLPPKKNLIEYEHKFALRVIESSRVCRHVFRHVELLNAYIQVLKASTRARVQDHDRNLPSYERAKIVRVRQVGMAEGKSQCAFIAEKKPKLSKYTSTTKRGPAQKKQTQGQTALLINAPEAGELRLLPVAFTPTRSVGTATCSDAPVQQARQPSYRPNLDPTQAICRWLCFNTSST